MFFQISIKKDRRLSGEGFVSASYIIRHASPGTSPVYPDNVSRYGIKFLMGIGFVRDLLHRKFVSHVAVQYIEGVVMVYDGLECLLGDLC
jgi:hypothetical protein